MVICMVYYGLSLGVGSLSNNEYISLSLSGIVEIPSYLMAYVMLDRWERGEGKRGIHVHVYEHVRKEDYYVKQKRGNVKKTN